MPLTRKNVLNSDGTVIFGRTREPGSRLTMNMCLRAAKPVYHVHDNWYSHPYCTGMFRAWVDKHNIKVLNVAGNRESKNPGIQKRVREFLISALKEVNI